MSPGLCADAATSEFRSSVCGDRVMALMDNDRIKGMKRDVFIVSIPLRISATRLRAKDERSSMAVFNPAGRSSARQRFPSAGSIACLPETANGMILQACEAAREIDSQYVVTYRPLRPLAEAKPGEYRKLEVISRRVGLRVRSRRGYVVNDGRIYNAPRRS